MRRSIAVSAWVFTALVAIALIAATSTPEQKGRAFDGTVTAGTGALVGTGVTTLGQGFHHLRMTKTQVNEVALVYVESRDRSGTLEDSMTVGIFGACVYELYFREGLDSLNITENGSADTISVQVYD